MPGLDAHGYIVANWLISLPIYGLMVVVLAGRVFVEGLFGLLPVLVGLGLMVLSVVFPIIAGIKAGAGERWPYPFSIPFFNFYDAP